MSLRGALRRRLNGLIAGLKVPTSGRILLYHYIAEEGPTSAALPRSLFKAQLDWLAESGLRGASVEECVGGDFPTGTVGISFDDGHVSAAIACELILARGWTATLFVCPGWIDGSRPATLGWSALEELHAAGIEVASHGLAHERLCHGDVPAMTRSLRAARERIEERVGSAVGGLAYPYGLAPANARRAALAAGYVYACTSEPGRNRPEPGTAFALSRNEVMATDSSARLFIGKLGGSDDWMAPVRRLENAVRCRR